MHPTIAFARRPSLAGLALAALIAGGLLAACDPADPAALPNGNLSRDFQYPRAARDIRLFGEAAGLHSGAGGSNLRPRTDLDASLVLQDVLEDNLDSDASLEQILVCKHKDDQEDLLRVLVVDFDESRALWAVSWMGVTRATNNKTFTTRVMNLNALALPELVCQGTNNQGEQTLDIFHPVGSGEFPLEYASALSISADIGIEVYAAAESSAGALGESDSATLPARAPAPKRPQVVAQSKDLESQSPLDMVQTSYQWKAGSDRNSPGQYLVSETAKIAGATVQEAALDQLYQSPVNEFEKRFLEGGWVHTYVNQRKKTISQIIYFDVKARTVRFIELDRMESHEWVSSHKPSYGSSLQVYLVNESFHSLKTIGLIQVTGLNSINFSLQDRDDWQGSFIRLEGELAAQHYQGKRRDIPINSLVLSGLYRNEGGTELVFDAPRLTWREGGRTQVGSFLTYEFGSPVLELEFIDLKGLVQERRWYIASLTEYDQGQRLTQKVLELRPAELRVDGIRPIGGDPLHLVQAPQDYSR